MTSDREIRSESRTREGTVVAFGGFRIDFRRRKLSRDHHRLRIQRKPLDVLIFLVEHADRLVTREELLATFWNDGAHDEALTRCISILRKVLADTREPHKFIETVWGQGYRFLAAVQVEPNGAVDPKSISHGAMAGGERADRAPRRVGRRSSVALTGMAVIGAISGFWFWSTLSDPVYGTIKRLAVTPVSATRTTDQWLAEALTDHLADTLSLIEGITVIARGSLADFPVQSDPVELGRALGVDAILVAELFEDGELIGMRAQLLSTGDGSVLWRYSVPPRSSIPQAKDVEDMAGSVAQRLWATLQLRPRTSEIDAEAYRHYLRGRYYWKQRSKTSLNDAIVSFERALAIAPDYADALVGLAESWLLLPLYGAMAPSETIPQARRAAEDALKIDPRLAPALAVVGTIEMQYDWNWTAAEAHLREALTLDPNDATIEQWLGELHCYRKRFEECSRHLQSAAGLDPLSPVLRMLQGSPALWSGDFGEAIRVNRLALDRAPEFGLTRYVLGLSHAGLGDWDGAIEWYLAARPALGLEIVGGPLIYALAQSGDRDGAMALTRELEKLSEDRYVPPSKLAIAWIGLGEPEVALAWLEQALLVRDDRLVYLAVDRHFHDLYQHPKFRDAAARIGVLDLIAPP